MGTEHGGGGLRDTLNLLVMPIVHGPSVANFEKPAKLQFFAGNLNDLQRTIGMEVRKVSQEITATIYGCLEHCFVTFWSSLVF